MVEPGLTGADRQAAALRAARVLETASRLDSAVDAVGGLVERLSARWPGLTAALHGEPLGHPAHPLLTDVPIGLWTAAGVLDLVGGRRSRPAADCLVGLGVVAFFPTAAAGWADWTVSDRAVRRVGLVHALLNGAATLMYGTSWALRRGGHRGAGVTVSLSALTLVTVAGYLGGHLVFRLGAPTGGPVAARLR